MHLLVYESLIINMQLFMHRRISCTDFDCSTAWRAVKSMAAFLILGDCWCFSVGIIFGLAFFDDFVGNLGFDRCFWVGWNFKYC